MEKKNILMIHNGRCGSTVVENLLGQNPKIHNAGEVYTPSLEKWKKANPGKLPALGKKVLINNPIEILKESMDKSKKAHYLFAVKPFHFKLIGYSAIDFLNQTNLLSSAYFVLTRRKNVLREIISTEIARKTNVWHLSVKDVEPPSSPERIYFPFKKNGKSLIEIIQRHEKNLQDIESSLLGKKILNLTYENDIEESPQKAYKRVCEFVGIEPTETIVRLKKTNPFQIEDMLENFDEVKSELKNTPYEWMLYK